LEAPWALGALAPKKRLKRPDGGLGFGGKGAENSPPGPPFSVTFPKGTETYAVYNRQNEQGGDTILGQITGLGNNVAIFKCLISVTERSLLFCPKYQTKIQRATDLFDWIIN
jgi:hypothetical protein